MAALICLTSVAAAEEWARGVAFHDRNGNAVRDSGEEGLPGVAISNGREVVLTDALGRWTLPVTGPRTIFFVNKPAGYMVPVDGNHLPRFYYVHCPQGSPDVGFPAIEPTGPLPDSINFALRRNNEDGPFRVLVFGDTQPYTQEQVDFMIADIVPELAGTDAAFGITLGDLVGDDLALFSPYIEGISQIGVPWLNVAGNHDLNFDAPNNTHATDTFMRHFGPRHYAFGWGEAHFIVLYNVDWRGGGLARRSNYGAKIDAEQLAFVEAYLSTVAKEDLIVLAMHIPLRRLEDRPLVEGVAELFALFEDRPHTLSFAAHSHTQEQYFLGPDDAWVGPRPHHHIVQGTVSGSWWRGSRDEFGIPHALMRDGTPRGYAWLEIEGNQYTWRYQATRRPADFQMFIDLPVEISAADAEAVRVHANIFGGNERSTARLRFLGTDSWIPMERTVAPDPRFTRIRESELHLAQPYARPIRREAIPSTHLWAATLQNLPPGPHTIEVETKDMFGRVYSARRAFRVLSE